MSIETLGEAYEHSWRVRAQCVRGYIESPSSMRKCDYRAELDMQTLVWSKGRNFPIGKLGERLICPRCGCREVNVMLEPPPTTVRVSSAHKSKWE